MLFYSFIYFLFTVDFFLSLFTDIYFCAYVISRTCIIFHLLIYLFLFHPTTFFFHYFQQSFPLLSVISLLNQPKRAIYASHSYSSKHCNHPEGRTGTTPRPKGRDQVVTRYLQMECPFSLPSFLPTLSPSSVAFQHFTRIVFFHQILST